MFKHIYFRNFFNFLFCPERSTQSVLMIISAKKTSVRDYFRPQGPIQSVRDYF